MTKNTHVLELQMERFLKPFCKSIDDDASDRTELFV